MVRDAPFFPCHITLFTKRVTNVSLNFGSGARGNFFALDFLIIYRFRFNILFLGFFALGTVLGTALLSVFHTCSIQIYLSQCGNVHPANPSHDHL